MKYLQILRISNWIKNLFIFIPLFFSSELLNSQKIFPTIFALIGFSFVSSFVYIINDIFDIEFDKKHPLKKYRPIASGNVSIVNSLLIGFPLLLAGLFIIHRISVESFILTLIYILLNLLYSLILKNVPIIDFIIISIGFVLRIYIGGYIGEIILSQWIIILVFLISLFIAITKRRDDVFQFQNKNKINRKVVTKYNLEFMDKSITIITAVLIVTYILFISSGEVINRYQSDYLFFTVLPVLIGLLRYNQITYVYNKSGSPIDTLFKDRFLQITLMSWILMFYFILYSK